MVKKVEKKKKSQKKGSPVDVDPSKEVVSDESSVDLDPSKEVVSDETPLDSEGPVLSEEAQTILSLKEKIKGLEAEVLAQKDMALRSLAESENFKRRKQQETENIRKYAAEDIILSFLPVIDALDLAFQQSEAKEAAVSEFLKGFELVRKQFVDALKKVDVVAIEALDQPFNPDFHQAMSQEEVEGKEAQIVVKEMQKGYLLHDKVIRPSLVVVSK